VACLPRGRAGLALYRLRSVLPDLTRVLGPQHPETLAARFMSVQVQGETGALPQRVTVLRELTDELTTVLGPGHPDVLAARYCLAEWLEQDGRTDEAEAVHRDVIDTGTRTLGPDHLTVLIARSSLTIIRYHRAGPGDDAAIEDMTEIVAAMERAFGPAHPTAAATRGLLTRWRSARAPGEAGE
jgi:hypothetical protein